MYHLTGFALFRVIHIQVSALIPCQYVVLVTSYLHTCLADTRGGVYGYWPHLVLKWNIKSAKH